METASLIPAAAVLGAGGVALALLGRTRAPVLAGVGLLGVGEAGLAWAVAPTRDLPGPAPLALGLVALGVVVAGLTIALVRYPLAAPVALVSAAPFRLPVDVGGEEALLLVPLYIVLAGATLAFVVCVVRGDTVTAPPLALAVPAVVFIGLAAVSTFWSRDMDASAVDLAFFYFPFAVLVAVVARVRVDGGLTRALAAASLTVAVILGAIGLSQLVTHDLPFAEDLERSSAYSAFFRTTSLFPDPSIYGRHLVAAILIVVVALWLERIGLALGSALVAFFAAALFFTYSQSSMVALVCGLLLVTFLLGDRGAKVAVVAGALAIVVVAAAVVLSTAQAEPLRRVTSGRSDLVLNATEIAAAHPVGGVGIGAEAEAAREVAQANPGRLAKPSHTTPLTVAAELGALGLAAFLLFLAGAGRVLAAAVRRSPPLGIGIAAVFLAVFIHSLFYAGFFEDPNVWIALALAGAVVAGTAARRTPR